METENDMKFDYSVGTEQRFAFRKWMHAWADQFKNLPMEKWQLALDDDFLAEGFRDDFLNAQQFEKFLVQLAYPHKQIEVRLPQLSCSYSHFLFSIKGDLQIFIDGILCFEGNIEGRLRFVDETFSFAYLQFYPRMSMHVEI